MTTILLWLLALSALLMLVVVLCLARAAGLADCARGVMEADDAAGRWRAGEPKSDE